MTRKINFYPEEPVKITEDEIINEIQETYNIESLTRFVCRLCRESTSNNVVDFVLGKHVVIGLLKNLMKYHKAQGDNNTVKILNSFIKYYKNLDY